MRERTEAVRSRQVQIEQQQIGMRVLLERCEHAANAVGLQELHVAAGRGNGTRERRAVQRMVIGNEDLVIDRHARQSREPAIAIAIAVPSLTVSSPASEAPCSTARRRGVYD